VREFICVNREERRREVKGCKKSKKIIDRSLGRDERLKSAEG
jgi:hypothetical protein